MTDSSLSDKYGHKCRQLTDDEVKRLDNDRQLVSQFRQNKLETEAKKNWDLFYKRNTNKFFKDRHWTQREFQELIGDHMRDKCQDSGDQQQVALLEVGCGVGNTIWPLIEDNRSHKIFVCDFSPVAIDLLKENPLYDPNKCTPFVADITEEKGISKHLTNDIKFDLVTLFFVLSAIHPDKMKIALHNIYEVLSIYVIISNSEFKISALTSI